MQKNELYLFDIRTRKYEKMEVKGILNKKAIEIIDEEYFRIGLKVSIDIINYPEKLIRQYFEFKGYIVIKCSPLGKDFLEYSKYTSDDEPIIVKYLNENYEFYAKDEGSDLRTYLSKSGIPDFIVYRKEHPKIIHDLFFVEVKNWNDGIKGNQLLWMFQTNAPIKIACMG